MRLDAGIVHQDVDVGPSSSQTFLNIDSTAARSDTSAWTAIDRRPLERIQRTRSSGAPPRNFDIVDGYISALLREYLRDTTTYTAGGSSDQSYLAFKLHRN